MSLAILATAGRVNASHLTAAIALLPALIVGAAVSRLVHDRVGSRLLRLFVLLFALISGTVLVTRNLV